MVMLGYNDVMLSTNICNIDLITSLLTIVSVVLIVMYSLLFIIHPVDTSTNWVIEKLRMLKKISSIPHKRTNLAYAIIRARLNQQPCGKSTGYEKKVTTITKGVYQSCS